MREILFRGKRLDNGKWVEGFYSQFHNRPTDDKPNLHQIFQMLKENDEPIIIGKTSIGGIWHTIDEKTLGQFTGLCDKNGRKIFEGDIIELLARGSRKHKRYVVFYDIETGQRLMKNGEEIGDYENLTGNWAKTCCEVIGNIYDNPELLGEKK